MRYGVKPLEPIDMSYTWMFDDLSEAKDQAWKLVQEYGVDVIVFQALGTQRNVIEWTPE